MAYSGIGGQAVMEGVMMKNKDQYAVAVRTTDGSIVVDTKEYKSVLPIEQVKNIPLIRGVVNFIDSLVLGMKSLTFSASFFEEEEEEREKKKNDKKAQRKESIEMGLTVALSILLAIGVFMLLPFGLSLLFQNLGLPSIVISIIEGVLRVLIFLGYMVAISLMEDIKRVYMYHGAEHKCINCIESGLALNVENVRNSSRQHKRCGTSFMFLVIMITVVLFLFIQTDSAALRLIYRILLIPVVAGISYEFIRLAGRSNNWFVNLLSKPGLFMQKLTTKEPDDAMIEVAIASVEAVFDWKKYQQEEFGE